MTTRQKKGLFAEELPRVQKEDLAEKREGPARMR